MSLTPSAPPVRGRASSAVTSAVTSAVISTVIGTVPAPPVPRRVRHQARDAVAVMVFSATASSVVAAGLVLLTHLSQAGR
jgi:ABC-type spermidine/putrescine transport system permease subunit II